MATQRQLAKYLDTSEHAVRDLVKLNVFPTNGRAGYDLDVCRVEYIRYLRSQAKTRQRKSSTGLAESEAAAERLKTQDTLQVEKARLAAEQANKAAMENAMRRRELLPVALMTSYAARLGNHVRSQLESLPSNMKRRIPHLRSAEVNLVKQEVTKISDAIADFDISNEAAT